MESSKFLPPQRMHIGGIFRLISPFTSSSGSLENKFLPEYIRKKITHCAKSHHSKKDITIKEEPLSEHFKVYTTKKPQENKFILKGQDFIAFEVSCQIAQLNPQPSNISLQALEH